MSEHAAELDAQGVRDLFSELSDRLQARGVHAQLFVVGGAAMALAYDRDRLTRDVDALFVPTLAVREIAEEIGAARDLEPDWLNDAAKGFLPGADERPRTVFESESLLVQVPSPQYLLALKLHASRDERDLDDAAILFCELGYTTAQESVDLLAATYPDAQLLPRHRYVAEDVARRAEARRAGSYSQTPPNPPPFPPPDLSRSRQGPEQGRRLSPPESFGRPGHTPPGPNRPPGRSGPGR